MAYRWAFRIVAGTESEQPHYGGKVISSRTKPSASRAANALRLAANGLHRSDSALGAFLRRKKTHLGAPKAITATAHKLARIIYSTLKYGQEYSDAGADYYETQYRQRSLRSAKRRAAQLGYQLVPLPFRAKGRRFLFNSYDGDVRFVAHNVRTSYDVSSRSRQPNLAPSDR